MFDQLSNRLGGIFDRLRGRGALTEAEVESALREIRIALLEADVALPVAKEFIEKVKPLAIGQDVLRSVKPGQQIVKIVHDYLIELLGGETAELDLKAAPPAVILMAGLQGSGKTTSAGKLAKLLQDKKGKKVLLASLDIYRPAAQQQLEILATQIGAGSLPIVDSEKPLAITERALTAARREAYDVLILDTAGRLHIDDELMQELKSVQDKANPIATLLVADAMTGQDAVNMAKSFHEQIRLTGIVLTRLDGDARGGAALSMRNVTGCPIQFVGLGEKMDQFEVFHPARMADRILGMGDVVSLVEKAAAEISEQDALQMMQKMESGRFDLDDLAKQLKQIQKLGGAKGILNFLPGAQKIKAQLKDGQLDDKNFKRQEAILSSMTKGERKHPDIIKASRKKRIAAGSGVGVHDVNKLLKQYEDMSKMMKQMKKMGGMKGLAKMMPGLMKGKMPPGMEGLSDLGNMGDLSNLGKMSPEDQAKLLAGMKNGPPFN